MLFKKPTAFKKAKTAVRKIAKSPRMGGALSNRDVSLMKKAAPRAKMGALSNKDMSLMKKMPKKR